MYINASSKPDTYPRRPSNCVYDSIYAKLLLVGRIGGVHTSSKRSIEDGVQKRKSRSNRRRSRIEHRNGRRRRASRSAHVRVVNGSDGPSGRVSTSNINSFHCFPRNYATIVYFCLLATFGLHYITLRHFIRQLHYTVTNGAATKSFKYSECELKKMSFQNFFESISVCEFLKIGRKGIPCFRSGERETTLAEL